MVDSRKVVVKAAGAGLGAFAAVDLAKGEVVECGVERDAVLSGCAAFYATCDTPNARMIRDGARHRWEVVALRAIARGEELRLARA